MHNQGVCYTYLNEYLDAKRCLRQALTMNKHELTFIQLGKVGWWIKYDADQVLPLFS